MTISLHRVESVETGVRRLHGFDILRLTIRCEDTKGVPQVVEVDLFGGRWNVAEQKLVSEPETDAEVLRAYMAAKPSEIMEAR